MSEPIRRRRQAAYEETRLRIQRQARLRRLLRWAALAVIAAVAVAGIAYWIVSNTTREEPGISVSIQGAEHVGTGQPHPSYNTTPPTSGWHYSGPGAPAPWGIHQEPIPDEVQVHNLEHGGIMVQYKCDRQEASCQELVKQLERIVGRYRSKVILAPYPSMQSLVALTAWGQIRTLEAVDEKTILAFIEAYKNKGPEQVPD